MTFSREQFEDRWRDLGENQASHSVDTAWRRYQQTKVPSYVTELEMQDLSSGQFQSSFQGFLENEPSKEAIADHCFVTLRANRIPWTVTDLRVRPGQVVSTFASGRVWRSRELDLWLRPQFTLWFKIGVNGRVFNSTWHTNTFTSNTEGELYVANQFPGQFGEPVGGRLSSQLSVYDKADGRFEILVVTWKDNVNVLEVLEKSQATTPTMSSQLIGQELDRIKQDAHSKVPDNWHLLWFLGTSSIYTLKDIDSQPCMHCKPYLNTGILQKDLTPPVPLKKDTRVSWDWLVTSLPSRLREDLTITHDYLSIAFEFENGRDLTYTWSWELPKEFGYWCPIPSWSDREYHVVVRSGTDQLGQWIGEERDLYVDYVKYIENAKDTNRLPKQIVRVWFIAGNRWQRYDGEMSVKQIRIVQGDRIVEVL